MYKSDNKVQVASISGGRTSHYMITVLEKIYGRGNVVYVYCDTGAEHPGTYQFIRDTEKYFNIDIVCLRSYLPKEDGVGVRYDVVGVNDIQQDFKPFRSLMEKYGRPFNPGGKFCTDQMKTTIFRNYCKDMFGDGNYTTWIGYRNEPLDCSRVWGRQLSASINKHLGISRQDQGEFYIESRDILVTDGECSLLETLTNEYGDTEEVQKVLQKVVKRVTKHLDTGYRFLFEIDDKDKQAILDFWKEQPFDLDIPEGCGNCVFCIEKSENILAHVAKTQPEQFDLWKVEINNPNIPYKNRKTSQTAIYRKGLSLEDIGKLASDVPIEDILLNIKTEKKLSPCSAGECSVFGDDDEPQL